MARDHTLWEYEVRMDQVKRRLPVEFSGKGEYSSKGEACVEPMGEKLDRSRDAWKMDFDGSPTLTPRNVPESGNRLHRHERRHPGSGHYHSDIGLLGRGVTHALNP
jgi:hypothetical protein